MSGLWPNAADGRRAVFLDRDGVLIRDVDHLAAASQIEILRGVPEALRRLRDAGWTIVVVTNQSVVARGLVTEEALREIRDATGMPISEALKRGLRSLVDQVKRETRRTPYDIYRELDHGRGGSAIARSTYTRRAVRAAIKKKLGL